MNYEQMSDFEINKAVAQRFYSGMSVEFHQIQSMVEVCDCTGDIGTFDYCNNPADAWPVIFENKISLVSPTAGQIRKGVNKWAADHDYGAKFWVAHENPLRAAMIVFLMTREDKA